MLQESYRAFLAVDNQEDTRIVDMINGDVVTDSESDDPKALLEHSVMSDRVKKLIAKRQKSIKRKKQRRVAKLLFKRRFLCRKVSKTSWSSKRMSIYWKRNLLANGMWVPMHGGQVC